MPSKRISISFSKSKKVVPHRSLSSSPNFEFAENNPMIRKEILEDILDKFPNKNIKNTKIEKINEESKKIYPLRNEVNVNHGVREERDNRTKKFENINKMYEVSNINSKKHTPKYTPGIKSQKGGRRRKTAKKYKRTSK